MSNKQYIYNIYGKECFKDEKGKLPEYVKVVRIHHASLVLIKNIYYDGEKINNEAYKSGKAYKPELLRFEFISDYCKVDLVKILIEYKEASLREARLKEFLEGAKKTLGNDYNDFEKALINVFNKGYKQTEFLENSEMHAIVDLLYLTYIRGQRIAKGSKK
jgi:hypothetical protein